MESERERRGGRGGSLWALSLIVESEVEPPIKRPMAYISDGLCDLVGLRRQDEVAGLSCGRSRYFSEEK
ncbi:hypothetical protein CASFOL_018068 [Castilleja foliolosa]|uniref:PAS domain-containing protein n=1 Tax=Castilleja foliolosa TaxID=1961234 RepID=A0ABD3D6W7_9LAMI